MRTLIPPVRPTLSAKNIALRLRVALMYLWYAPSKLPAVDRILCDFADMDNTVMERLITKYGPEPPFLLGYGDTESRQEAQELVEACVDFSLVPTDSAKTAVVDDVTAVVRALSRGNANKSQQQQQQGRDSSGLLNTSVSNFMGGSHKKSTQQQQQQGAATRGAGFGDADDGSGGMTAGDLVEAYGFSVSYFDQFMALFVPSLSSKTTDKVQLQRLRQLLEQYAPNEDKFYAAIAHRVAKQHNPDVEQDEVKDQEHPKQLAEDELYAPHEPMPKIAPVENQVSGASGTTFSREAQRRMNVAADVFGGLMQGGVEAPLPAGMRPVSHSQGRQQVESSSMLQMLQRYKYQQLGTDGQRDDGVGAEDSTVSSVWAPFDQLSIPSMSYHTMLCEELTRSTASSSGLPELHSSSYNDHGRGGSHRGIELVTFEPPMFSGKRRLGVKEGAGSRGGGGSGY